MLNFSNSPLTNLYAYDLESLILAEKYAIINPNGRIERFRKFKLDTESLKNEWGYWIGIKYQYKLSEKQRIKKTKFNCSSQRVVKCKFLSVDEFKNLSFEHDYVSYFRQFCYLRNYHSGEFDLEMEREYDKINRYNDIRVEDSFILSLNINPNYCDESTDINYEENIKKFHRDLHKSALTFIDVIGRLKSYKISYITIGILNHFEEYVSVYEDWGEARNKQYEDEVRLALESGREEERNMDYETGGFWRFENDLD